MDIVHMQQNAFQIRVIKLVRIEENIRDNLLWQKEMLIGEAPNPDEYDVPEKFRIMDSNQRIGFIRALRWVLNDTDEDLL